MKGIEKYAKDGKGSIMQADYGSKNPLKKASRNSKSVVDPMSMGGCERANGHAKTSFSGAVVAGSHKANS